MGPLQTVAGPRLICVLGMQQFKDHCLFCVCACSDSHFVSVLEKNFMTLMITPL